MSWPDIEAQLAEGNISPGSALERLVRDNQDFSILGEEEAEDSLGYPLWLRVYWRKNHPEAEYDSGDPTRGYPRSLSALHQWMMSHQDLESEASPSSSDPSG